MKKFEYKSISSSGLISMDYLRRLGEEGWELVSFSELRNSEYGTPFQYYFKKEIEE